MNNVSLQTKLRGVLYAPRLKHNHDFIRIAKNVHSTTTQNITKNNKKKQKPIKQWLKLKKLPLNTNNPAI